MNTYRPFVYNVQYNSPQLAFQQNLKNKYKKIIKRNQILQNKIPKKYSYYYYQTAYDRFLIYKASSSGLV